MDPIRRPGTSPAATSAALFERARRLIPGGVNSPVRSFRGVGGSPVFMEQGQGCRLKDVTGRWYIDYIGAWGPLIAGHAHPEVVRALEHALRAGTAYGTPCPQEVELAAEIVRRMPSVQQVRMVNSGTEAVMSAIRLARAVTGRDLIVKFDGCYHGHADAMLVRAGSGAATFGLPDSPGVTAGAAGDTRTAEYNNLSAVEAIFAREGTKIAAVIVEPIAGNMGVVPPDSGFLEGLRALTRQHHALLIFDEVMTGFRVSAGGAQGLFGVTPDLTTLGKIIGGGLPVGAFGGRTELMERLAPVGDVYQAGTMSGNPLAMTAGLATLGLLDDPAYARLERQSARLEAGLRDALANAQLSGVVQRVGSMLTLYFRQDPVRNLADTRNVDAGRFAAFFHAMLARGVHLPPSGFEAWFVSLAHDDEAIDETIAAARAALAETREVAS